MKLSKLKAAIAEAERFLGKAKAAQKASKDILEAWNRCRSAAW